MTLAEEPGPLAEGAAELEAALKAEVAGRPLSLYRMMAYHMGWVEETGEERLSATPLRPRGALTLLACRALGGKTADALPHACAVEYLFNHTLIHDDIRDGNSERDGRASVWWVWGPAQAINTGDGMHALARLALFEPGSRGDSPEVIMQATRMLDEANLRTCEGQYRDITLQERLDVGTADYIAMAEAQSGALPACAARLGALATGRTAGGAERELDEALGVFGARLGTAMRLADDYRVFWSEGGRDEARQGRLAAKKKMFPVAHVIEHGSPSDRRKVGQLYMQRLIDPDAAGELKSILESNNSGQHTLEAIDGLLEQGAEALAEGGLPAAAAEPLLEAARYLAGRPG